MEVKSSFKYARISPMKARDVARQIQGMPVSQALDVLQYTPRKAAHLVGKTVRAAVADAENNFELDPDSLVVKSATVGEGPAFRRFKPRARGSASAIRKRTSHIFIVLSDEVAAEPEEKATKAKRAPKNAAKAPKKEESANPADDASAE
ncbi:MAG: 50S ribosomal protein L22 [Verrucomicrobiales bacterium]